MTVVVMRRSVRLQFGRWPRSHRRSHASPVRGGVAAGANQDAITFLRSPAPSRGSAGGEIPRGGELALPPLVESVLDRGLSKQDPTPRAISNPARVSRCVCRRPERLRPTRPSSPGLAHGRKYGFWG